MITAITSIAPNRIDEQQKCAESWLRAGLRVTSLNCAEEIETLDAQFPGVIFHEATNTTERIFRKPYVAIDEALRYATELNSTVLLLNSDIELRCSPWQLVKLAQTNHGGLVTFSRHNHNGDYVNGTTYWDGIDGFMFHGRDAHLVPCSFLSFGQCFWDYLLPLAFHRAGRPVYNATDPLMWHRNHAQNWDWNDWYLTSLEIDRALGQTQKLTLGRRVARAQMMRQEIHAFSIPIE
jgi:hypothetical protein